jgi:methionyl-tRNA synthetase
LAAGVPLPRQVYVHGFIYARGERLSKSLGNLVDPVEMARAFGTDALRFYLLDSFPTGRDGEFTVEQLVEHVNSHLANKLGNLASRTVTLVNKHFDGKAPAEWNPDSFQTDEARVGYGALIAVAETTATEAPKAWEEIRINDAMEHAWNVVERANEFVDRTKPWEIAKDPARREELATVLNALLETLRWWRSGRGRSCRRSARNCGRCWACPARPRSRRTPTHSRASAPATSTRWCRPVILFPRIDLKSVAGA